MRERETVLTLLAEHLDRAGGGTGTTVFVVGEAGLGKTTVLERARAVAGDRFLVAGARGDLMESSIPFGFLAQALDALGAGDILDVTVPAPASDVRAAKFFKVLRWIQQATTRPLLLLLDDLQWADQDSVALLSFLSRRLAGAPVVVIASLRPWPRHALDAAGALTHAGNAVLERLEPLSDGAAAALVQELAGRPVPENALRRAVATCAGNPLLLEQVALAIGRGEEAPAPGDHPAGQAMPTDLLLARFATLPEPAVRYAQAASVLGPRFHYEIAAEVARIGEAEAESGLDALWSSGLLKDAGAGRVEFAHALFAQALYSDLGPPLRDRLHRRAFAAFADRGQDAEAAEHAIRAHTRGAPGTEGERAVQVLERAGRMALAAGAVAVAARHLQAAADVAGSRASSELLVALGEVQLSTGRVSDAAATYGRLLAEPALNAPLRVRALRTRGRALHLLGESAAATRCWEEVVQVAADVQPQVAVEALLDLALGLMFSGGPGRALPFAERAREVVAGADEATRRLVQGAWGLIAQQAGQPAGIEAAEAAARASDIGIEPLVSWEPRLTYAFAATWAERFEAAEAALEAGLASAEQAGAVAKMGALIDTRIFLLWRRGRLVEARAACEQAAGLSDLTPLGRMFLALVQGLVALAMGRDDEVDECVRQVEPVASSIWAVGVGVAHLRGVRLLRAGEAERASEIYSELYASVREAGVGDPSWPVPWARRAMAAHAASGRLEEVEELVGWLRGGLSLGGRWPRIAISAGSALLAEARGDAEGAERHLRQALAHDERGELPLERVESQLQLGSFLRRSGRPASARPVLAEALRTAEACGAAWLEATLAQELSVAGGRRRRSRGPDELTGQELRVAQLAGQGRTNKEIAARLGLSVSTIETHLEHVYLKLGIGSRRQLMQRDDLA